MQLELVPVSKDEKEILRNLMEKYDYEFSQYVDLDVNPLGLYGYDYFDCYWTEDTRHPFFIKADGKLVVIDGGFCRARQALRRGRQRTAAHLFR